MPILLGVSSARAETLTAGVALNQMTSVEFNSYTQGIVEGLAQGRYEADGGNADGMHCIYDWYYQDQKQAPDAIAAAFSESPSSFPGELVSGLVLKECPVSSPAVSLHPHDGVTAGWALDNMKNGALGGFMQGVLEGLAQARREKDGSTTGMQCIYEWFYSKTDVIRAVFNAFDTYPKYSPGAVMSGLIRKECPP